MLWKIQAPTPYNKPMRYVTSVAASAVLCATTPAHATQDPWFGHDKALHFGATSTLSIGGYTAGRLVFEDRTTALAVGAGVAMGAGIAKELADLAGAGDPSWRDLTWNLIGTVTGLAFAWTFDKLIERIFAPAPEPTLASRR